MIAIQLPKPEKPWHDQGSNEVTFRIVSEDDVKLLKAYYGREMNIKSGDLLIILEPDGYEEIAGFFCKRHNPNEKYKQGWISELGDLFEHVMGNSEWDWIPGDDDYNISNAEHMYVDDQGEIRVLTGFWSDDTAWRDDPVERLFVDGYRVYTFHAQSEYSGEEFFDCTPEMIAAWKADVYGTFSDLMEADKRERFMHMFNKET
jgi:hypothetical protein